ncbi:hypothetical protein GGD81_004595 [Rhodobium orientis]|nr:hypothetical protein [Rhodobium orientis]MBB4305515.1 hypothetical protein [Rhodobium orientis]
MNALNTQPKPPPTNPNQMSLDLAPI